MKPPIFILLLAGLLVGCQKEPNTPVSAALKAAYLFQPGSYWVYQDSISGEIDSMYIESIYSSRIDNGQQTFDIITVNTIRQTPLINVENKVTMRSVTFQIDGTSVGVPVFYPFIIEPPNTSGTIVLLSNLYMRGKVYNNIDRIRQTDYPSIKETYYMDMNIGIIKISTNFPDSVLKVFELINYKIVR